MELLCRRSAQGVRPAEHPNEITGPDRSTRPFALQDKVYGFATNADMQAFLANPTACLAAVEAAVKKEPLLARPLGLPPPRPSADVHAVLQVSAAMASRRRWGRAGKQVFFLSFKNCCVRLQGVRYETQFSASTRRYSNSVISPSLPRQCQARSRWISAVKHPCTS